MNFIEKLDMLLKNNDLNKSSLSKESGIPYTTIDGWYKKGYESMQLSTLKKLSKYFDTTLDFWAKDSILDPNYGKYSPSESPLENGIALYFQLDENDKAEIRGEMKQMLKADKYHLATKETIA